MSFHKWTEADEQELAAKWERARASMRQLKLMLLLLFAVVFGSWLYFAGEHAGLVSCQLHKRAELTP